MKCDTELMIILGGALISIGGLKSFLRWRKKKMYKKAVADQRFERILNEITKRQREEEELWR